MSAVSEVLELLAAARRADRPTEEYEPSACKGWTCVTSYNGMVYASTATTKREAKNSSYQLLLEALREDLLEEVDSERQKRAANAADLISKAYMYKSIGIHLSVAQRVSERVLEPVIVLTKYGPFDLEPRSFKDSEGKCINYSVDLDETPYAISATAQSIAKNDWESIKSVYLQQPGTESSPDGLKVLLDTVVPNNDDHHGLWDPECTLLDSEAPIKLMPPNIDIDNPLYNPEDDLRSRDLVIYLSNKLWHAGELASKLGHPIAVYTTGETSYPCIIDEDIQKNVGTFELASALFIAGAYVKPDYSIAFIGPFHESYAKFKRDLAKAKLSTSPTFQVLMSNAISHFPRAWLVAARVFYQSLLKSIASGFGTILCFLRRLGDDSIIEDLLSPDSPGITYDPSDDGEVIPNNQPDMPVEPVAQVGVMDYPGTMTIPHLPNPQPTAITPAAMIQDQAAVAALEPLIPSDDLNPLGPPNMLGVGAITYDLKDLVYSQFLDCDNQISYTDTTSNGTVLFQIPYDPLGQYVNPYIQQWVKLNPRYTGALNFRITVIGNATFSGLFGVAWIPQEIQDITQTVPISELMKQSYTSFGINEPVNRIFVLNDARQNLFWRLAGDKSDTQPRPALVGFIYVSAASPLVKGITIRIRIASCLSDGTYGPKFQCVWPTLPSSPSPVPPPGHFAATVATFGTYAPPQWNLAPYIIRGFATASPNFIINSNMQLPVASLYRSSDTPTIMPSLSTIFGSISQPIGSGDSNFVAFKVIGGDPIATVAYLFDFSYAQHLVTAIPPGDDSTKSLFQQRIADYNYSAVDNTGHYLRDALYNVADIYAIVEYQILEQNPEFYCYQFYDNKQHKVKFSSEDCAFLIAYTSIGPVFQITIHDTKHNLTQGSMMSIVNPSIFRDAYPINYYTDPEKPPVFLPLGWRTLTLSVQKPESPAEAFRGPCVIDHASIPPLYQLLTTDMRDGYVNEFTFNDLDSGQVVLTLRYDPKVKSAYINLGEDVPDGYLYAAFTRPLDRLRITNIQSVLKTSEFPITNYRHFASLAPPPSQARLRQALSAAPRPTAIHKVYDPSGDGPITPNAFLGSIAGGALGGIGQGLGHWAEWEQRKDYQSRDQDFMSRFARENWTAQLSNNKELALFYAQLRGGYSHAALMGLSRQGFENHTTADAISQRSGSSLPSSDSLPSYRTNGGLPPIDASTQTGNPPVSSVGTNTVSNPPRSARVQTDNHNLWNASTQTEAMPQSPVAPRPSGPTKLRRSNAMRSYDAANSNFMRILPQRRYPGMSSTPESVC